MRKAGIVCQAGPRGASEAECGVEVLDCPDDRCRPGHPSGVFGPHQPNTRRCLTASYPGDRPLCWLRDLPDGLPLRIHVGRGWASGAYFGKLPDLPVLCA